MMLNVSVRQLVSLLLSIVIHYSESVRMKVGVNWVMFFYRMPVVSTDD